MIFDSCFFFSFSLSFFISQYVFITVFCIQWIDWPIHKSLNRMISKKKFLNIAHWITWIVRDLTISIMVIVFFFLLVKYEYNSILLTVSLYMCDWINEIFSFFFLIFSKSMCRIFLEYFKLFLVHVYEVIEHCS